MRQSFISLFILLLSVAGMFSCKKTKTDYEPYISYSAFLRNPRFSHDSIVGCQDTVLLSYDNASGSYLADTIELFDTVLFVVGFGSRGNDLEWVTIETDTTMLQMSYSYSKEIYDVLDTEGSKPEAGTLSFKSGYNFVMFPVQYTALKSGSANLKFTVASDSQYSPLSLSIIQPVRE